MVNKKAEVRMSNLLYTIIIATGVIVLFSTIAGSITHNYGYSQLPEYELLNGINISGSEVDTFTSEISDSQNINETNKFKQWIESGYNLLTDNIIAKAFKTISIIPKSIGIMTKSINSGFEASGLDMPVIKWVILSLMTITVIIALLRAYWEKRT